MNPVGGHKSRDPAHSYNTSVTVLFRHGLPLERLPDEPRGAAVACAAADAPVLLSTNVLTTTQHHELPDPVAMVGAAVAWSVQSAALR